MTSEFVAITTALLLAVNPAVSGAGLAAQPSAAPVSPAIAPDWAAASAQPALPSAQAIKQAVRETAIETLSAEPARRHEADTLRGDKYDAFAADFADAKVPGCLRPDGLKRQSTFIFGGLLALPFIAVAALRGKCT